jgi:hypothetical protein
MEVVGDSGTVRQTIGDDFPGLHLHLGEDAPDDPCRVLSLSKGLG